MRYQAQSFIKQVQIDLLALSDADLFYTIDQWVSGKELSDLPRDAPEGAWSAVGYTLDRAETDHLSSPPGTMPQVESEAREHWLAPSPHHLRRLLTEMDLKQFAQHVITMAFQSLHPTHPEWGDGSTFNAHLANHLRWIRVNRRSNAQSAKGTPHL
jgi:hypothetical protein